jgi:hypothetical protein
LDTLVKDAKALVSDALADGMLDADEVLRIAMFVAEKANVLQGLSGPERRRLVIRAVEVAVKSVVPPEQAEQVGSSVALQVLPSVLDIAVSAARGKISLGKVVETAQKKWSLACLLGCLGHLWTAFVSRKPEAVLAALEAEVLEPVKSLSESASLESEVAPPASSDKGDSPAPLSQTEPSPVASAVVVPLEIRPPESAVPELPNTATPEPVLEPRTE